MKQNLLESQRTVARGDAEQSAYYAWRGEQIRLFDEQYTVFSKPGMPESGSRDPATLLLAEYIEVDEGETLLNLNCGSGLVGTIGALLSVDGKVVLTDTSVVAVKAARKTLAENSVENAAVVCSNGTSHLDDLEPVDVITIRLPKGKQPSLQLLWDGFQALKPGGRLYLTGANEDGIKSYLRHMEELFGNGQLITYRKGCRVGVATKQQVDSPSVPEAFAALWLDHAHVHTYEIEVESRSFAISSRPGVFSWDRLDAGSRALIDTMEIRPADRVLELGCGYGIVGALASVRASSGAKDGSVTLVDSDIRAVEAARRTIEENGLANCTVMLGDCAQGLANSAFDVVVTNAPFHQGTANQYEVAHQFIRDGARVLKRGGRFYLVANQFISYEEQVAFAFGDVETVYQDGKFKVLCARKR